MMDTERFKQWLVDAIGYDRSEANDICVSGWPSDVERHRRLLARFEQHELEEHLTLLPFDRGFAECVGIVAENGKGLGVSDSIIEWAQYAHKLVDQHNPALSYENRREQ